MIWIGYASSSQQRVFQTDRPSIGLTVERLMPTQRKRYHERTISVVTTPCESAQIHQSAPSAIIQPESAHICQHQRMLCVDLPTSSSNLPTSGAICPHLGSSVHIWSHLPVSAHIWPMSLGSEQIPTPSAISHSYSLGIPMSDLT